MFRIFLIPQDGLIFFSSLRIISPPSDFSCSLQSPQNFHVPSEFPCSIAHQCASLCGSSTVLPWIFSRDPADGFPITDRRSAIHDRADHRPTLSLSAILDRSAIGGLFRMFLLVLPQDGLIFSELFSSLRIIPPPSEFSCSLQNNNNPPNWSNVVVEHKTPPTRRKLSQDDHEFLRRKPGVEDLLLYGILVSCREKTVRDHYDTTAERRAQNMFSQSMIVEMGHVGRGPCARRCT